MTLVLLPGLDGTGELFANFVTRLPANLETKIIRYPADRFLSYGELFSHVLEALPQTEPFILLGESFSSPLAIKVAAENLPNLRGLIICAGFIKNPLARWLALMATLARPFIFRVPPPRLILEYFLTGRHDQLGEEVCRILRSMPPDVVFSRIRSVIACDVTEDLARVRVPTLYLQATLDRLLKKTCFQEIQRIKGDTILVEVPAPHLLLQREPQGAADSVIQFLDKLQN